MSTRDSATTDSSEPGPPFEVGERVVFFPAVLGPSSMWLAWDEAVITEIDVAAESFAFYFVSEPDVQHRQGLENVVRPTAKYRSWRARYESVLAATGDEDAADLAADDLRMLVIAEHPIHGPDLRRD